MSTGPGTGVIGAWLTDVDDTLLKSGHRPDDHWIGELAQFVRTLRKHGILWAPVSGVAISKMGPRMLYRLPEELLDNVFYFGGEGSTRSHFHAAGSSWVDDPAFKRYLTLRARALITDDYLPSDMAWMDLEGNDIDVVIGPIENYEDGKCEEWIQYVKAQEGMAMDRAPQGVGACDHLRIVRSHVQMLGHDTRLRMAGLGDFRVGLAAGVKIVRALRDAGRTPTPTLREHCRDRPRR